MGDWDTYQMDCDFTNKEPTIGGFIITEIILLLERIEAFFD